MNFTEKSVSKKKKALTFYNMRQKGRLHLFFFKITFIVFLTLFLACCGLILGFVQAVYQSTPSMTIDSLSQDGTPSVLYDNTGDKMLTLDEDCFKQTYISLNKIPQDLQNAVIAIDDPNYYTHNGINGYSIINSLLDSFTKEPIYGNSHLLTEQLIENQDPSFVVNNNLFSRLEYSLRLHFKSISLEKNASKPQILEYYLNTISFGNGIIGVEAASQTYFNKSVSDLTLSECCILAATISNPYEYNPLTHEEENQTRRVLILENMKEREYITSTAMRSALRENSYENLVDSSTSLSSSLSGFEDAALEQLAKDFNEKYNISTTKFYTILTSGNLEIYTTQDTDLQKKITSIVNDDNNYSGESKQAQVSFTMMEQSTGYVQAIIGGRKEQNSFINRPTDHLQQPGTLFHVLATYLPGLDEGTLTLASTYDDSPYQYVDNKKEVFSKDGIYDGITTIREAIPNEMNIIAARAQTDVTPKVSYDYLTNLGFSHLTESTLDSNGNTVTDVSQSISSGTLINGVSNLEITQAVSTLGNSGYTSDPALYTRICDKNGTIILEKEPVSKKTIHPSTAFLITDSLMTASEQSELPSNTIQIHGSNQEQTDYWCTGYTPNLTATLWLGYDDNRSFQSNDTEKRIWKKIMEQLPTTDKPAAFSKPSNLVTASICQESGKLAVSSICDQDPRGDRTKLEYFTADTLPTTTCNTHVEVTICKKSGMLISNDCPKKDYLRKIYVVLPAESKETRDSRYTLPKKYMTDERCHLHTHRK